MSTRQKRNTTVEHTELTVDVTKFEARVTAAVNHELKDLRYTHPDTQVYRFESGLELEGQCTYPDSRAGTLYTLDIHGHETASAHFATTLENCQVLDKDGFAKLKKVRGKFESVYDIPRGIGLLESQGKAQWRGFLWVPPQTLSDMLILLQGVPSLSLAIHEIRQGSYHWIARFVLQTNDPVSINK